MGETKGSMDHLIMLSSTLFFIALLLLLFYIIFPFNTLFLSFHYHPSIAKHQTTSPTNHSSPPPLLIEKPSLERIEDGLSRARAAISEAIKSRNYSSYKQQQESYVPRGSVYRNPYAFHQSHIEMEKRLKVWVYKEGDPPLVHGGPMHDIYGIEGQFINEMEGGKSHYIAGHPDEAHMFFLPISVANIISFVYRPLLTYSRHELQRLVTDYIRVVADKYPYWNRSTGADHFLLSCHDWAPDISGANPELYKNMIRALCNANKSKTFKLIPGKLAPTDHKLAKSQKKRTKLAFFAGGSHGYIRKVLLEKWKDKDNEIEVHEYLPNKNDYFIKMGMTKFCLCTSGYEVASPRVVTAIQLGCVPVIISDNYFLPFSDALDWTKFSVHIPSKNISKIKMILQRISGRRYLVLQSRVMQVR